MPRGVRPPAGLGAGMKGLHLPRMADLYAVLGVPPTADARDIRRAYLRLAQQYHPDHDPRPEAAAKFLEVQAAYEELSDPAKRQRYDARRSGVPTPTGTPPPGPLGDVMRAVQEALRQRGSAGAGREQTRTIHVGNVRVSMKVRVS
jgi:DnaJ-class molecular chaperone